jgi:hypothetical protein
MASSITTAQPSLLEVKQTAVDVNLVQGACDKRLPAADRGTWIELSSTVPRLVSRLDNARQTDQRVDCYTCSCAALLASPQQQVK